MGVWSYGIVAAVAYLLGSIPSGVIAGRALSKVDVRMVGSGHTGMLNTYRAAGKAPAVITLVADGAKGMLAVLIARWWLGESWGVPLAATLAVIGHCYPHWTRFRGGMGMATAGGVMLLLQPLVLILLLVAWFPLKRLLRESAYASIVVALLVPGSLLLLRASPATVIAGIGLSAVLALRHLQVLVQARRFVQSFR